MRVTSVRPHLETSSGILFAVALGLACVSLACTEAKRAVIPAPDVAVGLDTVAADGTDRPEVATGPCSPNPCVAPHRTTCVVASTNDEGFRCDCDANYAVVDDICLDATCADEVATTGVTVIDLTPLADETDPVKTGFDPLLPGDSVRVVVEFARTAGSRPARVVIATGALVADPSSFRLNDEVADQTFVSSTRIEVAIPAGMSQGHIFFEGKINEDELGLLAMEARVMTTARCYIIGSGSGARIQLAGAENARHSVCNNLKDMKSLQISTGVPDKDTLVYQSRNGLFDEVAGGFTILTQMTLCLERPEGFVVSLAGSADGTRPWTIDNHLLIEAFSGDPSEPGTTRVGGWITTSQAALAPSVFTDGGSLKMLAHASIAGDYTGSSTPARFSFPAKTVQLNGFIPVDGPVWLRLTGLDSGGAGHLSRLFLNVSPAGADVPECRSAFDCPAEDSFNGASVKFRSGCIAGLCTRTLCSTSGGCAAEQICLQGFCTDGCDENKPCGGTKVCANRVCSDLAAGGCATFDDCPTGQVCFFGQCEAGCFHPVNQSASYADNHSGSLCTKEPEACPRCGDKSTRCWNNYCRDCEIDAHCDSGQICNNFKCEAQP